MASSAPAPPRTAPPQCPVLSSPLDRDAAEELAEVVKALADPARLQLLSLLRAAPHQEACACQFVDALGLSQPTVSHHLKVLFEAGVIEREQRGKWVYYRLPEDRLPAICAALL
jgi:ArsR family transcriptional regulator, arsenate/arsenite/antimonite-responsive transcriptional repressor